MSTTSSTEKSTSTTTSSGFPSLRLGSLEEVLLKSVIQTSISPQPSVQGGKEPLSLQATSSNFRRFVQKSGPIFVAQDAVEAVLKWEDPIKTSFFAVVWAFICYTPQLILFIPTTILIAILLTTYNARRGPNPPPDDPQGPTTLNAAPPTEGSVDYLANLQNIQIMMGRLADASDFGRSFVPYLTWHNERLTRSLLHLSVVTTFVLALIAPYIPWRMILFISGESLFLTSHPVVQNFLSSILNSTRSRQVRKRQRQWLERFVEDDGLTDFELDEMEIVEVIRVEIESRSQHGSGSSTTTMDTMGKDGSEGWENEVVIGGELPVDAKWLGSWLDCIPEDKAVDTDGWTYLHLDGSRSSSPLAETSTGTISVAQSRRRKMIRRCLKPLKSTNAK